MSLQAYTPKMKDAVDKIAKWRSEGRNTDWICNRLGIKKGVLYYFIHKEPAIKEAMDFFNTYYMQEFIEPILHKLASGWEQVTQNYEYNKANRQMELVSESRRVVIDSKVAMFLAKAYNPEKYGNVDRLGTKDKLDLEENLKEMIQ